jgi:hypothetical protein
MPLLALKVATLAAAALGVAAGGHAELAGHSQEASVTKVIYIVRSGDTLGGIAGYFCHDPAKYRELAQANGIANPNEISVGEHIWLACGGSSSGSSSASSSGGSSSSSISGSSYAAGSAAIPATDMVYSYAGLERLWEAAGGSSATAYHAACIAEHESSGRPWAISPTNDWGLWQIHNGGQPMLVPFQNAQRAVAMSGNGSNWGQWTTARYC